MLDVFSSNNLIIRAIMSSRIACTAGVTVDSDMVSDAGFSRSRELGFVLGVVLDELGSPVSVCSGCLSCLLISWSTNSVTIGSSLKSSDAFMKALTAFLKAGVSVAHWKGYLGGSTDVDLVARPPSIGGTISDSRSGRG